MDELLKKMLDSDLLTEDTKQEISDAFTQHLTEMRSEIEADVKVELAEKYISDKEALIEALDSKLDAVVDAEFAELKEDIERFRDLEAEHAVKLVEARREMAATVQKDMKTMLEALDAYVETRLTVEFDELRESITEVKKEDHGRKVLEVIGEQYMAMFSNQGNVEKELNERKAELDRITNELREAKEQLSTRERAAKLESILESLTGDSREVMGAILENVPTDKLEDAYTRYIGRVIRESVDSTKNSEKDKTVLAENVNEPSEALIPRTGDRPIVEDVSNDEGKQGLDESVRAKLKKLSGIE